MDKQKSWRGNSLDRESMEPLAVGGRSTGLQDSVAEMPLYKSHSPKLHRPTPVPRDRVSTTSVRSDAPSMQSIHDDEPENGAATTNGLSNGHARLSGHDDHNMDEALLGSDAGTPEVDSSPTQMAPPRHVRFHSRGGSNGAEGTPIPLLDTNLARPSGGEGTLASPDHTGNREAKTIATNHIHSQEHDLEAVVRFLRTTHNLSFQVIGDLIGEHCDRCQQLLELFTDSFDFTGLPFETALRGFLEAFRLPGESQKIERILTSFADQYWRQCGRTSPFRNATAVCVLAYSVVLLNTDLHSQAVKKGTKMTMVEYVRNCRQINDGQDFSPEMLEELYINIQQQSLRVPPNTALPIQGSASKMHGGGWSPSKRRSRCCGWF